MAFIIKLKVEERLLTEEEKFGRKIKFIELIVNKFKNYFEPKKTIIMLDAPLTNIGGEIKYELNGFSEKQIAGLDFDYKRAIVKIEGIFKINIGDEKLRLPAFIYLYNKDEWRRYYDIEFDIYSFKNIESISDIVLMSEQFREDLINFVESLAEENIVELEKCFVGSLEATENIRERTFSYYRYPYAILLDMIKTIRNESIEGQAPPDILKHLIFYKTDPLTRRVWSLEEFQERFDKLSKEFGIIVKKGSIFAIADKKDSFNRLYTMMKNDILIPSIKKMEDDDKIVNKFKQTITGDSKISNYTE